MKPWMERNWCAKKTNNISAHRHRAEQLAKLGAVLCEIAISDTARRQMAAMEWGTHHLMSHPSCYGRVAQRQSLRFGL